MELNTPSDITADLRIGATDKGQVRLYIVAHLTSGALDIPMDFEPHEAEEIAREIAAAATLAAKQSS